MKNPGRALVVLGLVLLIGAAAIYFFVQPMAANGPDPASDLQKMSMLIGALAVPGVTLLVLGFLRRR